METSTWFDVASDHGALELHEELTAPGPALELHVVIDSETSATIAWWEAEGGMRLAVAAVGNT